ncbi:MAG: GNAT family N-acetyltransferase [Paracoccaceae bacterium]
MKNRDIGEIVNNWQAPVTPTGAILEGTYARLESLQPHHHAAIHQANTADDHIWDYMPYGPFADADAYSDWANSIQNSPDPFFYAIYDKERGDWAGVASYLRITPQAGSIEVGNINYSPQLQKTRAATETMFLMMQWAFDAGYRRYEWKCDARNLGSRRAAQRFGFSYEGIFRQALMIKGRNRDTAWFAAIDSEWPALKIAFETWLSPDNFDVEGRQRIRLSDLTAPILVARDGET